MLRYSKNKNKKNPVDKNKKKEFWGLTMPSILDVVSVSVSFLTPQKWGKKGGGLHIVTYQSIFPYISTHVTHINMRSHSMR